ncbi:MAG: DUF1631 family protein, partial [Rhodoferax sp.]|nr:DUF1631 family protein [Rhodoferax sp.]
MAALPARQPPERKQALYRSLLQDTAAGAGVLMGKLVAAARLDLQAQEAAARDLRLRDALLESANLLRTHEAVLCQAFAQALQQAFEQPQGSKPADAADSVSAEVHFDQLELMDDTQVQATVTLARVQQAAMLAAEAGLAELNTLVCSVLGMDSVRADLNPLRPEVYVQAIQVAVAQTRATAATQAQWLGAMSATLGRELRALYLELCARLRQQGVVSVTYAMPAGTGGRAGSGAAAMPGVPSSQPLPLGVDAAASGYGPQPHGAALAQVAPTQALLTLDRLHRLLSGALQPAPAGNRVDQFAAQFAQQFEDAPGLAEEPHSDFASTVPAALEALNEMQQVERVVQSLEQRRGTAAPAVPTEDSVEGQRLLLRRRARDIAQVLSLEVVTLMVENMAQDARLLEPVRQVVRNLEPALLRLALVDQRFFTDKQHPARRLLQELTHRSMAFESATARGFDLFVKHLQVALAPLLRAPIESAEVFEQQLHSLQQQWRDSTRASEKDHHTAIEALQRAEARNLLAESIAKGIEELPDAALVPAVVIDFLCGPWAQVLAQTRIQHGAG